MAATTFSVGPVKFEATGHATYNGQPGIFWVQRTRCDDGSGWLYVGTLHIKAGSTRRQIVEAFKKVFETEQINKGKA